MIGLWAIPAGIFLICIAVYFLINFLTNRYVAKKITRDYVEILTFQLGVVVTVPAWLMYSFFSIFQKL